MPTELTPLARAILDALLDQFEQPARRRVARVRLNERDHRDYFHAPDFAARRDTNRALQQLAERGCLRLHWRKWEEGNWLEKADLIPARAATIYELLSRTPIGEWISGLRELLDAQSPVAPWQAEFVAWAKSRIETQASVAPLRLNDAAWNRDLLRALDALARLDAPLLERKFSVRLFGDSKRFTDLRAPLLQILRRHDAAATGFGDDDPALLRSFHLERNPEYVTIAGPLVLQGPLDLTPFDRGVAVPATTLRAAAVSACSADAVVTIENLTSFSEFVAVKPPGLLAIYTGGFASPTVIALLRGIRDAHASMPFFHWSDLDAGGLRILAHLRTTLPDLGPLAPLAMDVVTFDAHRQHARALTPREREGLMQLRAHPALNDCQLLLERLLEAGLKLEQEAVDAETCLNRTIGLDSRPTINSQL
jgi:hypothetical protein